MAKAPMNLNRARQINAIMLHNYRLLSGRPRDDDDDNPRHVRGITLNEAYEARVIMHAGMHTVVPASLVAQTYAWAVLAMEGVNA